VVDTAVIHWSVAGRWDALNAKHLVIVQFDGVANEMTVWFG
jgi:hypothetical protein